MKNIVKVAERVSKIIRLRKEAGNPIELIEHHKLDSLASAAANTIIRLYISKGQNPMDMIFPDKALTASLKPLTVKALNVKTKEEEDVQVHILFSKEGNKSMFGKKDGVKIIVVDINPTVLNETELYSFLVKDEYRFISIYKNIQSSIAIMARMVKEIILTVIEHELTHASDHITKLPPFKFPKTRLERRDKREYDLYKSDVGWSRSSPVERKPYLNEIIGQMKRAVRPGDDIMKAIKKSPSFTSVWRALKVNPGDKDISAGYGNLEERKLKTKKEILKGVYTWWNSKDNPIYEE